MNVKYNPYISFTGSLTSNDKDEQGIVESNNVNRWIFQITHFFYNCLSDLWDHQEKKVILSREKKEKGKQEKRKAKGKEMEKKQKSKKKQRKQI